MRDMQTITSYFYAVYILAAVIIGGYVLWILAASRKAKARLEASPQQ